MKVVLVLVACMGVGIGLILMRSDPRPRPVEATVEIKQHTVEKPKINLPPRAANWLQFYRTAQTKRWSAEEIIAMVPEDCKADVSRDNLLVRHRDNLISVSFKDGYLNTIYHYKTK